MFSLTCEHSEQLDGPFPLTPALSLGERENCSQRWLQYSAREN